MDEPASTITIDRIRKLKPGLHQDILDLCCSLDPRKYPEATAISEERSRTIAPLLMIYERLSKEKKERGAKKRAKEAEKIILSINTLFHGRSRTAVSHEHKTHDNARTQFNRRPEDELARTGMDSLRRRIETMIASGTMLQKEEILEFVRTGYREFVDKTEDADPIAKKPAEVKIIMCSDARQPIGEIVLEANVTVKQVAGNSIETIRDRDSMVIVIGHGGYQSGCGAVKSAQQMNSGGKKADDPHIESITTGAIPKRVTDSDHAERQNVIYQAMRAQANGSKAFGIYFDMETKEVSLVYGEMNAIVESVMRSVSAAVREAGDLSKQTAGFALLTREGRRFPGKTIVSAKTNQVFESCFYLGKDGEPKISPKAIGSLKYATSHIAGVDKNKVIAVVDPDVDVAKKVAKMIGSLIPDSKPIALVEDWKSGEIREA